MAMDFIARRNGKADFSTESARVTATLVRISTEKSEQRHEKKRKIRFFFFPCVFSFSV
jgi:hypothetical protein